VRVFFSCVDFEHRFFEMTSPSTNPMARWLADRFGGKRAALRYALHQGRYRLGAYRQFSVLRRTADVRLVFFCKGNICRSPFAERYALSRGLDAASFGLEAGDGSTSPKGAVDAARAFGIDLETHRARSRGRIDFRPMDLLLAFEPEHAQQLSRAEGRERASDVVLLGLFSKPRHPYLHDPYGHGPAYFDRCYRRIAAAIDELVLKPCSSAFERTRR